MTDAITQLYRHFDKAGTLLYVGISLHAVKRLSEHDGSSPWYKDISHVTIEHFPSRQAAEIAEKKAIKKEKPRHNIAHVDNTSNHHVFSQERTALELLWGADAIAKELGRTVKSTFHMLESGHLPFARKIKGRWCASRTKLHEFFEAA